MLSESLSSGGPHSCTKSWHLLHVSIENSSLHVPLVLSGMTYWQNGPTLSNICEHIEPPPVPSTTEKKRKYSSAYSNHVYYILLMKLILPGVLIVGWSSSSPGSAEALPWWPRTRSNRTIANVDSELVSIPCMLSTYQKWLWYLKNQTAAAAIRYAWSAVPISCETDVMAN